MARASELLEREIALTQVGDLVRSVRNGEGGALMIDGEAGTGKSVLAKVACEQAAAAGLIVLRARGGALERDFGFGVARQLFEPQVAGATKARRAKLFAGAAELAGPVTGYNSAAVASTALTADPMLAAQHGLYWLTANMANSSPLLICVDDVHWADRASVAWLLYLIRRLEGLPIGVIAATRIGEPAVAESDLRALRLEAPTSVLFLDSLTRAGSDRLVGAALGAETDELFRAACHAVSGGNPFYLSELVSAAAEQGIAPIAESVGQIVGLGRDRASGHILLRVARLGADAKVLARSVAVLGAGATARRAGLSPGREAECAAARAARIERTEDLSMFGGGTLQSGR